MLEAVDGRTIAGCMEKTNGLGFGVRPPGAVVDPCGNMPRWGWGRFLDNLELNNN